MNAATEEKPEVNESADKSAQKPKKKPWPAVKRGHIIGFNPEGNDAAPQIAIAKSAVSSNGRIDLLVLPDNGGEVIPHDGVPFVTEFEKIENPATRRNGSWGKLN